MKTYETNENLKQLQQITFGILSYFDGLCKKLDLRYFLAYGTLIGAVRHQGFIPWDDDVDVWMPRPDFMKLLDWLYTHENERFVGSHGRIKPKGEWSEKLQIKILDKTVVVENRMTPDNAPAHPWIDVFALDNVPDDHAGFTESFEKCRKRCRLTRSKHVLYPGARGAARLINRSVYYLHKYLRLFTFTLNEEKSYEKMYRVLTAYESDPAGGEFFCNAAVYAPTPKKCYFKQEWFAEAIELPYESGRFPVPAGYDAILKKIYGDYMTPPPDSQRHGGHFGKILSRK